MFACLVFFLLYVEHCISKSFWELKHYFVLESACHFHCQEARMRDIALIWSGIMLCWIWIANLLCLSLPQVSNILRVIFGVLCCVYKYLFLQQDFETRHCETDHILLGSITASISKFIICSWKTTWKIIPNLKKDK